jgi:hypothetical protein
MSLSNTLLINRNSSTTTITKFILERLALMVDYYYLGDTIIQKESNCAVSLTYCKLIKTSPHALIKINHLFKNGLS